MCLNKESKILITGGSGFIGTNLITLLLDRGYAHILSLDVEPPKLKHHEKVWRYCDIRIEKELFSNVLDFDFDFIIHLAAETALCETRGLQFYSSNTTGVVNLISLLNSINRDVFTVFTSTMLVNYNDGVFKPNTLYGESKVIGEDLVANSNLTNYCIVRPTSIWGPWFGEPYFTFFKIVMANKYFGLSKKRSSIKTFGYVENVVNQYETILKRSSDLRGKTLFLGDKYPLNVYDFSKSIAAISATRIKVVPFSVLKCIALLGDILSYVGIKFPLTSFRLRNLTNDRIENVEEISNLIKDEVSLEGGIRKTVEWINERQ